MSPCADPDGGGDRGSGPPPPGKSLKKERRQEGKKMFFEKGNIRTACKVYAAAATYDPDIIHIIYLKETKNFTFKKA